MKRYSIDIETTYGRGIFDGDQYSDLRIRENETGEWIKACDVESLESKNAKLESKIERMQAYINKIEGRS